MFMYDYSKLRGKVVEKFGSIDNFSKSFGETPTTVGKKLSNKSEWSQSNISKAIKVLGISAENIPVYFFTEKVEINSTLDDAN